MKRLYSILSILLISVVSQAQPYETNPDFKRANIWHFGAGAGIDFNSGSPVPIAGGQTGHTWEGFSTLCDTGGNLMFYTDGQTVWNKNHSVIENGTGLISHTSSTQASLFVQHPENDTLIYLFTTRPNDFSNAGFRFNKINTKSNSGLGSIVEKNQLLLSTSTEKVTAVKHRNGKDYWIIAHGFITNSYFAYLLTKEGLNTCPVESKTGNILIGNSATWSLNTQGNLISNYKGNQLLNTVLNTGKVDILNFNNELGTIEFVDSISFNSNSYCVAYSLNDKRIFIQTVSYNRDTSYYYYYENGNLHLIDFGLSGQIQYMVNMLDNIYIGNIDSTHLSSITGINDSISTFNKVAISLSPSYASIGLNNFSNSYHYTPSINFTYELDCITNKIQFNGQDTFNANNHSWLIVRQGSNSLTSSIKNPIIELLDTGTYTVRYIASNGSRSDTVIKEVNIFPKINKDFLGDDILFCGTMDTTINLYTPVGMHCYKWNTGESGSFIAVDTPGFYWAKITTPNFCVIYDTVQVSYDTINSYTLPILGNDIKECKGSVVELKTDNEYLSYLWSNGSTSESIFIDEDGIYNIAVLNNYKCTLIDSIRVVFDTLPQKPVLKRTDDSLFVALKGNYTYQWFRNNELLVDTSEYLILPDTGTYFLKVSNSIGCSNYSDTIFVATLGIEHPLLTKLKIYPNPTNGVFIIEVFSDEFLFEVKDITGKTINKGNLTSRQNSIDISPYSDGVYFVTVQDDQHLITYKLIKQSE